MNKIPFYRERDFGEKVSVTFQFIGQNIRYVWRYLLYIIAPLGIFFGLSLNWFYDMVTNMQESSASSDSDLIMAGIIMLVLVVVSVIGYAVLFAMIYSIMQLYNARENGLEGVTYNDIRPYMKDNIRRMAIYTIALVPIGILVLLVFILPIISFGIFGFLLALVVLFLFAVTYQLVMPVYLNEDIGFFGAVQRGMTLAWNTFGGVLLLFIVFTFICNTAASLLSIPWAICYFLKMAFLTDGTAASIASSPLFNILSYVFAVIMGMVSIAAYMPLVVAMNYQYANAAEQTDNFSVDEEINDFEQL